MWSLLHGLKKNTQKQLQFFGTKKHWHVIYLTLCLFLPVNINTKQKSGLNKLKIPAIYRMLPLRERNMCLFHTDLLLTFAYWGDKLKTVQLFFIMYRLIYHIIIIMWSLPTGWPAQDFSAIPLFLLKHRFLWHPHCCVPECLQG